MAIENNKPSQSREGAINNNENEFWMNILQEEFSVSGQFKYEIRGRFEAREAVDKIDSIGEEERFDIKYKKMEGKELQYAQLQDAGEIINFLGSEAGRFYGINKNFVDDTLERSKKSKALQSIPYVFSQSENDSYFDKRFGVIKLNGEQWRDVILDNDQERIDKLFSEEFRDTVVTLISKLMENNIQLYEDTETQHQDAIEIYKKLTSSYDQLLGADIERIKELFPIDKEKTKIYINKIINDFNFATAEDGIKTFGLEDDEELVSNLEKKRVEWENIKQTIENYIEENRDSVLDISTFDTRSEETKYGEIYEFQTKDIAVPMNGGYRYVFLKIPHYAHNEKHGEYYKYYNLDRYGSPDRILVSQEEFESRSENPVIESRIAVQLRSNPNTFYGGFSNIPPEDMEALKDHIDAVNEKVDFKENYKAISDYMRNKYFEPYNYHSIQGKNFKLQK